MIAEILSWAAVTLMIATSVGLLINRDWRWELGLLALQYIGVFWLVQRHWPAGMAVVKLVTGWMAATVLGITQLGRGQVLDIDPDWSEGRIFRMTVAGLIVLVAGAATPAAASFFPGLGYPEVAGSLLLVGMGLWQLGLTAQPLRVCIGLLTALSGFEILYAALEGSVLVAALLALVTLGLALVGAYLLSAKGGEGTT